MAPLVSCIVPVFNGERYLNEALQSISARAIRQPKLLLWMTAQAIGQPRWWLAIRSLFGICDRTISDRLRLSISD